MKTHARKHNRLTRCGRYVVAATLRLMARSHTTQRMLTTVTCGQCMRALRKRGMMG